VKSTFKVTFWGVRGSIPVPGPQTTKYGGNTPCVEVRCADQLFVFDTGSGVVSLGRKLLSEGPLLGHIFYTHFHWDHIQGFPFFAPLFNPANQFHLYGQHNTPHTLEKALGGQMEQPVFPITIKHLPATLHFHQVCESVPLEIGPVKISPFKLNHPSPCLGYRLDFEGRSMVYGADNEHGADGLHQVYLDHARDADLVIFDAAYTDEEYTGHKGPPRKNWGHSTATHALDLLQHPGAKRVALFHHDYLRTDQELTAIETNIQQRHPEIFCAREGMTLEL